ncbi:MAG: hypothetical protein ABFC34_13925 [Methanobacterium sp.]
METNLFPESHKQDLLQSIEETDKQLEEMNALIKLVSKPINKNCIDPKLLSVLKIQAGVIYSYYECLQAQLEYFQ